MNKDFEEIIDFYYRSNYGTFDVYAKSAYFWHAFSDNIKDIYYNHIVPLNDAKPKELILEHKPEFVARNRMPAVCIMPLSKFYEKQIPGLKPWAADSWMKYANPSVPDVPANPDFSVVESGLKDVDIHADVFMRAFSDGVYAGLDESYGDVEKIFFRPHPVFTNLNLLLYYKGTAVGCVRAVIENDKAFIYALGVVKEYRFGGMSVAQLGADLMKRLFARGIRDIYMNTELGTRLESFYLRAGFERLFTGRYWIEE
ncbi:MAG: GNAT family N-acetyltransferase [Rickettsiales bacterium]|nr:GNAT family N-acetyltransferase [Rickettsiales bacterium]